MRTLSYAAPHTLEEAFSLMAKTQGEIRPIVGGTDLIDQMKRGRRNPVLILDVKHIPETTRIHFDPKEGLHLGSAVSCTDTYMDPVVKEKYPSIAESCALIGSIQIQNRASAGGNICNAAPSADTVPPLLVYEATAVIAGPKGWRRLPLEQFFLGPGKTVLANDEILVEVVVPPPPPNTSSHYLRFIPREEMDIAVAGVASLLTLDPRTGRCKRARIALAAVAPTPVRAKAAEALLEGKVITGALVQEAAEKAVLATKPITDLRGSIEYRKELVNVLTRRTLHLCLQSLAG